MQKNLIKKTIPNSLTIFRCISAVLLPLIIIYGGNNGAIISVPLLLLAGLISGNLWIYPRNIAQGWDATLAHVPYYNLRIEAINYLDKNNIEIDINIQLTLHGTCTNLLTENQPTNNKDIFVITRIQLKTW